MARRGIGADGGGIAGSVLSMNGAASPGEGFVHTHEVHVRLLCSSSHVLHQNKVVNVFDVWRPLSKLKT